MSFSNKFTFAISYPDEFLDTFLVPPYLGCAGKEAVKRMFCSDVASRQKFVDMGMVSKSIAQSVGQCCSGSLSVCLRRIPASLPIKLLINAPMFICTWLKASPAFVTDTTIVLVVFFFIYFLHVLLPALYCMVFSLFCYSDTGSQFNEHSASLAAF